MKNDGKFQKGFTPWNKGTKGVMKAWNKGNHRRCNTGKTHFKKGSIPWNKGLKGIKAGTESYLWKGDEVKYGGIHQWLSHTLGKASKCINPDCQGLSKRYEWAKLKNKSYERKAENFIELCHSCHMKYDLTDEWRKNMSIAAKIRFKERR